VGGLVVLAAACAVVGVVVVVEDVGEVEGVEEVSRLMGRLVCMIRWAQTLRVRRAAGVWAQYQTRLGNGI